MATEKPLRMTTDVDDTFPEEFGDTDLVGAGGLDLENLGTHIIKRDGNDMTFEDVAAGGPYTLTELLAVGDDASVIGYTYGNNSDPFVKTTSTSYAIVSSIVYAGSANSFSPSEILVILNNANTSGRVAARIFDVTNGLQICEITNINPGTVKTIYNMGTLSNIPSAAAIWEVQLKRDSGTGAVEIYGLTLRK